MALKVGNKLLEKGAKVTLVLTLEGVRIADTRQTLDLRWGMSDMTLSNLYEEFVKAGGEIQIFSIKCATKKLSKRLKVETTMLEPIKSIFISNGIDRISNRFVKSLNGTSFSRTNNSF